MAFESPLNAKEAIGVVEVDGFFLASSSASRRKWGEKHHLVDVAKLRPADDMLAVYTQAESGILADAWATALFVMGFERAREVAGVEFMLISKKMEIFRTSGFKGELFVANFREIRRFFNEGSRLI